MINGIAAMKIYAGLEKKMIARYGVSNNDIKTESGRLARYSTRAIIATTSSLLRDPTST